MATIFDAASSADRLTETFNRVHPPKLVGLGLGIDPLFATSLGKSVPSQLLGLSLGKCVEPPMNVASQLLGPTLGKSVPSQLLGLSLGKCVEPPMTGVMRALGMAQPQLPGLGKSIEPPFAASMSKTSAPTWAAPWSSMTAGFPAPCAASTG